MNKVLIKYCPKCRWLPRSTWMAQVVKSGTKGSIRIDALIKGSNGKPLGIFDLKTGAAGLTTKRINQIRAQLPDALKNIPIKEIR